MDKRTPKGSKRAGASSTDAGLEEAPDIGRTGDVKTKSAPKAIVGIGASAGGLDSFMRLISSLAADSGLAFVFVQHFDPAHETMLPDILRRNSRVPVKVAEDGMRVEPDHAYVIPPGTMMTLTDGHLKVVRRERLKGAHTVIDSFFKSLAEVHGDEARWNHDGAGR
jgi:chemotaxis response regulator CheB